MIEELLILALATSRLARLVVHDFITERIREWIWRRWPGSGVTFGDSEVTTAGKDALGYQIGHLSSGVEVFRGSDAWHPTKARFIGNLIECHWCAGVWLGFIVWGLWLLYPVTVTLAIPLALAEVAGLLNDRS